MFNRMKKRIDPIFFVFLLITFALISSLAVAVLYLFSQSRSATQGQTGESTGVALYEALVEESDVSAEKTSDIVGPYKEAMVELGRLVNSDELPAGALLEKTVQTLLGTRVPEQFLDQHLKAVLDLRALNLSKETVSDESLRLSVRQIINILLEQVKE